MSLKIGVEIILVLDFPHLLRHLPRPFLSILIFLIPTVPKALFRPIV